MKIKEAFIKHDHNRDGLDRGGSLECMAWAGTGMLWTGAGGAFASGVLRPATASAAEMRSAADFTFVQISDSHIGFNKDANKDVLGITDVRYRQGTHSLAIVDDTLG